MGGSPVHRLHPLAKIISALVYVAAVISFPSRNVSGLVPLCFYPVVMMALSGTPPGPLLSRFLLALPFAVMGGLSNLILLRESAFTLGAFTVTTGMVSAFSILLKTFLTVTSVLVLAASTPFTKTAAALQAACMPRILSLQFIMTWRYLSVLLGEASTVNTAYMLRSPGGRGIKMKDMGSFLGRLLLRSIDRAERVYAAMKCRGFDGSAMTSEYGQKRLGRMRAADILFIFASALFSLGLRFFNAGRFTGAAVRDVLKLFRNFSF
ncbi:MAG: energy-coupling factor transporter transmembrane protein EcfT [Treponema sp.]|jgi:cobalt/nickel transport system permease protein|nr:energy-coupling factor transporter transmembrane protein EcfT [Treponema sp.]